MIHPSGVFAYEAEFTADGFSESDVVLHGHEYKNTDIDRLVGHNPTIRFWRDRLVLVAGEQLHSGLRNFSFGIGDAVPLSARPGDQLYVLRTGSGGIGLSLLRENRLVLAIGAVTAVPLGMNVAVTMGPRGGKLINNPPTDPRLDFSVDGETLLLRERGLTRIGDYQVYIERSWEDGIPGTDECVSIARVDSQEINIASVRSAVILGQSEMKMTSWDGSESSLRNS